MYCKEKAENLFFTFYKALCLLAFMWEPLPDIKFR